MSFGKLEIIKPILNTLDSEGCNVPTEVQRQVIPAVLAGKDVLCNAAAGSGKTFSFVISILQKFFSDDNARSIRGIKALIISPDFESAGKTGEAFSVYSKKTKLKSAVLPEGPVEPKQINKLSKSTDILVASPNLLEVLNQGNLELNALRVLVLDDADVLFNSELTETTKQILSHIPAERQTLFFTSAESPEIKKNADTMTKKAVKVELKPEPEFKDIKGQAVFYVSKKNKKSLLLFLFRHLKVDSAVIFTKTKSTAERVVKALEEEGITSFAIHGSKTKGLSSEIPGDFSSGKLKVLVADDAAAPELGVTGLSHVFNYDIPDVAENYIERIGRTGTDGFSGTAVSFCDKDEIEFLDEIVKFLNMSIPVIDEHPFKADFAPVKAADEKKSKNTFKPQPKAPIKKETPAAAKEKRNIPGKNGKAFVPGERAQIPAEKTESENTAVPSAPEQLSFFPKKEITPVQKDEAPVEPVPSVSQAAAPVQEKKINEPGNRQQYGKKNFKPSGKKPFHKKKNFQHDNRKNFDKKRQQPESRSQGEKINPVVDNRSTSELKSLEIANRMHNRNQNKYGNNTERQISKVWTDHEEFISIGYKLEKKNASGRNGNGSSYNGSNHHKQGSKSSFGHKTWQGFDRNGTNPKFNNGKKKEAGTFKSDDANGNSQNFNTNGSFQNGNNQQGKKKKYPYNKNRWKK